MEYLSIYYSNVNQRLLQHPKSLSKPKNISEFTFYRLVNFTKRAGFRPLFGCRYIGIIFWLKTMYCETFHFRHLTLPFHSKYFNESYLRKPKNIKMIRWASTATPSATNIYTFILLPKRVYVSATG